MAYEQLDKAEEARVDREAAQRLTNKTRTTARTVDAIDFIVYLRRAGVKLRSTSSGEISGEIEVVGGTLKPETRAKLDDLAPELIELLQPDNKRGAAQILLAWLRANDVKLEATASGTVRVTRGRLSRESEAELVRLIPELVELLTEGNP